MLLPGQGSGDPEVREPSAEHLRDVPGEQHDQVRRLQHRRDARILLHREGDLGHQAVLDQGLQGEDVPTAGGNADEPAAREHLRADRRQRVCGRGEGHVFDVPHRRAPQTWGRQQRDGDREVDRAADESVLHEVGVQALHLQMHAGGGARECRHERRQERLLADRGEGERDLAGEGARIELLRVAHGRVDLRERLVQRAEEARGVGGRHHDVALAAEQLITEAVAQAPERVAHRRLGDVQAGRRRRDGAQFVQDDECAQLVQVGEGHPSIVSIGERDGIYWTEVRRPT